MERYYCQIVPDSLNHVSPSIRMLLEELDGRRENPMAILDIGCGNGRNSIPLATKYNAKVTVVDPDEYMLDWALRSFELRGRSGVEVLKANLEQVASGDSALRNRRFDVVILSYVLQHVEPSSYPLVFDFLHEVCQGYLAIDIFWNPSRCEPGATVRIGPTTWHGVKYQELVQLIAPRFEIVRQRIHVSESRVIINLVARQGFTPPEKIVTREYNYYLGQLHVRCRGWSSKRDRKSELISRFETMPSFLLLSSLFPGEMDLIKTEISDWLQTTDGVRTDIAAAKYLWSCRANKVPILLREVVDDFGITNKRLLRAMAIGDYIPPLETSGYIRRVCKQLGVSEALTEKATELENGGTIQGLSPAVRAGCAVLAAGIRLGVTLKKVEVAKCLAVSPVALRMNLMKSTPPFEGS